MFVPDRVSVEFPNFVRVPAPATTPAYVLLALDLCVRVTPLATSIVPPEPEIELTVSVASTSYVPPLTTTLLPSSKVPVIFKVPAETVVFPL